MLLEIHSRGGSKPEREFEKDVAEAVDNGSEIELGDGAVQHTIEKARQLRCDRADVHVTVQEVQLPVVTAHGFVVTVDQVRHVGNDGIPATSGSLLAAI